MNWKGRLNRAVPPLAMALSGLPILLGIVLHLRATSDLVSDAWRTDTGGLFVGVMLLVAACNRISALLCRKTAPDLSAVYFFGSAAAGIVAAAGLLRVLGQTEWTWQAPWLMLLPIGFILGSRFWRGHSPERPLSRVAHASTIVILLAGLGAAWESSTLEPVIHPRHGEVENLLLGIVFAEAAVFYTLAAILFGLSRLTSHETDWAMLGALGLTTLAGLAAAVLVPSGVWRRLHVTAAIAVAAVAFLTLNVIYYRTLGDDISRIDELALLVVTVLMVVTGYSWQVKSTTLTGGSTLVLYLVMIVVSLGWRQQLTVGATLAVLGALVFVCGIVLSICRQKDSPGIAPGTEPPVVLE